MFRRLLKMRLLFLIFVILLLVQSVYGGGCPAETFTYTYGGIVVTYDAAQDAAIAEAIVVCATRIYYDHEHHVYHLKHRKHCHQRIVAC